MSSMDRTEHPRIMMYSQDGFGLGHMRRTTSIARQILSADANACVLTLADSRLGQFFEVTANHDYVKLPSIVKKGPGQWQAVNLPLSFEEVHAMRIDLIRSAVLSFRPHVLLVDHMPHGAMGELLPTLDLLRTTGAATRVILGLRDILDAPHVVQQRWREEGAYEAIEQYYHTVLVYGEQSVFDMAKQYEFSPAITERMHYSGYVCTPDKARYPERARAKYATDPATKLIVVMAGGGADAYPMMRTSLEALPHIQKQQKATMLLNTGPFMPADLRRDLQRRARQVPGATVEMSVSDTLSYVEAADLVIGMCGYNTTMEILRSGNPAILIPRSGPSAEQLTRAQLFADRGWVKMMHPDQADSMVLADMALATLTGQDAPPLLARPTLQGIEAAADAILGYTRSQNRVPEGVYELLAERVAGA